jgi:hypothetical protein
MSFSSKNLLSRPVVTGNWALYLAFMIPFALSSFVLSILCGISHKVYAVTIRIILASWAGMFIILALCVFWYGRKTINRLSAASTKFNRYQQMIGLVVVCFILLGFGVIVTILQAIFVLDIDKSPTWFLLITNSYRVCALGLYISGTLYSWMATNRVISESSSHGRPGTVSPQSRSLALVSQQPPTRDPSINTLPAGKTSETHSENLPDNSPQSPDDPETSPENTSASPHTSSNEESDSSEV